MHEGHRARVKERFKQDGLDSFAPHEVLELLLFFAIPQRNVNPLAHALIEHFGSLAGVLEASPEDLCNCAGVGDNAATLLSMVPQLSAYYARNKFGPRPALPNVAAAGAYCQTLFVGAVREMLYLICLDTQKRVIQPTLIQKGTLDETPVYPRDVVAAALRSHAHAVVLAHNHPSGALLPSTSDYETTRMIISALGAVQIPVLDHIVVGLGQHLSMAEHSMMKQGALVDAEEFELCVRSTTLPMKESFCYGSEAQWGGG